VLLEQAEAEPPVAAAEQAAGLKIV